MLTLEEIEAQILALSTDDFEQLRQWFLDLDFEQWDQQIEQDVLEGKLEAFAQEALLDFEAGHVQIF
ncbi:MAG: hypothetical protein ACO331_11095 [Prochlorothrix sp.]